ncbi:MAG: carbonic anhydrase family protein [Gammaproteobacteria bacterium]
MTFRRSSRFNLVLALACAVGAPAAAAGGCDVYIVRDGDTLFGIASRNGVPVDQLARQNGLRGNGVRAGQPLKLAPGAACEQSVQAAAADPGDRVVGAHAPAAAHVRTVAMPQAGSRKPEPKHEAAVHGADTQAEPAGPAHAPAVDAAHAPAADSHAAPHWEYEGDAGPEHWAWLSREYRLCDAGQTQTPIDLDPAHTLSVGLEPVRIAYKPVRGRVVNNGHTIQVDVDPGSALEIDGERYELKQFHFHTPSEHTLRGRHYPMELHFVHRNAAGQLAVLGVMMDAGARNATLGSVWAKIPAAAGASTSLPAALDPNALLPASKAAFRYQGSLTTPPCSEGVKWVVLRDAIPVTQDQVSAFQALYPHNARPVQPINERSVLVDATD